MTPNASARHHSIHSDTVLPARLRAPLLVRELLYFCLAMIQKRLGEAIVKSRTSEETRKPARIANDARLKALGEVLARARDAALARVRVLRKEEEEDAIALPADRLDVARSLEDVEMEAGLIERCEDKLRAIDDAFSRLKRGRYGICEKCNQEIHVDRLKAVPFAAYCIDCQNKRNERRRPGEGNIDEPSRNVWTPPEELRETVEE